MPALLTAAEVAELFRTTPEAVHLWRKTGKLPSVKLPGRLYRFKRETVLAILGEAPTR